jgi:hypothetical protein
LRDKKRMRKRGRFHSHNFSYSAFV